MFLLSLSLSAEAARKARRTRQEERAALAAFRPSDLREAREASAWAARLLSEAEAREAESRTYSLAKARECSTFARAYDAAPTAAQGFPGVKEAASAAWAGATQTAAQAREEVEKCKGETELLRVLRDSTDDRLGMFCEASKA